MRILLFIGLLALALGGRAQTVYEPVDAPVYPLLEELTRIGAIDWNTSVRPISRKRIADFLLEARDDTSLTDRQKEEIEFYLRDYNWKNNDSPRFNAFDHSANEFSITVNPLIGGVLYTRSAEVDTAGNSGLERKIGAEVYGTAGSRFGYWVSLRDYSIQDERAILPYHQSMAGPGGIYKYSGEGEDRLAEWDEIRGGITYSWNWGQVGLIKDRFEWGNNQMGSNIFSQRAPSYFYVDLRVRPLDWLEFAYVHGWLNSGELDSSRTYLTPNGARRVFENKNLAANFATVKLPFDIDVSLGNSIIYSDNGVQPVYFIPFMFFKSIDHHNTGAGSNEAGQNSQMFFDLSVRSLPKTQVYASWFIDEVSLRNVFRSSEQTNIWSFKVGAVATNLVNDFEVFAEYTVNRPWVYRHQIETTTFASNDYNLGHYAGENSRELAGGIRWKPMRGLHASITGSILQQGEAHQYEIIRGNANVSGLTLLENVVVEKSLLQAMASYEVINDGVIWLEATWQQFSNKNVEGMPAYWQGDGLFLDAGLRYGF